MYVCKLFEVHNSHVGIMILQFSLMPALWLHMCKNCYLRMRAC